MILKRSYAFLVILALLLWCILMVHAQSRNIDAPFITTMLETGDGARIALKYRSIYWEPIILSTMQSLPEARDYYNTQILNRLAVLQTNVQLILGTHRLNPGTYYVGVRLLEDLTWGLQIASAEKPLIQIPLAIQEQEASVPFLSMVFTPGASRQDVILTGLYGTMASAFKLILSGVPSRDLAKQQLNTMLDADLQTLFPIPNEMLTDMPHSSINSATPRMLPQTGLGAFQKKGSIIPLLKKMNTPSAKSPKIRAGSGSLRYLFNKKEKNTETKE